MKKNFTELERDFLKRDLRMAVIALTDMYDTEDSSVQIFDNVTVADVCLGLLTVVCELDQEEEND